MKSIDFKFLRGLSDPNKKLDAALEEVKRLELVLREKDWEIQQREEELTLLHNKINAVSRKESTKTVCELAVEDMVEFFGFDYASLSLIDPLRNLISIKYTKTREPNLINPEDWRSEIKFSLDHPDILPFAVRKNKIIRVKGNIVDGQEIEIGKDPLLHEKTFKKFNHEGLIRAYIPIIRRAEKEAGLENDYPLGVIEVGYHISTKKDIDDQLITNLKLYIDNCAQPYYKAFRIEEEKKITDRLRHLAIQENPTEYLKRVLSYIQSLLRVENGDISFVPFNKEKYWLPISPIMQGTQDFKNNLNNVRKGSRLKDEKKIGIFRYAVKYKKYYFSNNVNEDSYYISGIKGVNSQLSFPLIYQGNPIGVLSLYSDKRKAFSDVQARIIERHLSNIIETYQKKKTDFTIKKLVKPINVFSENNIYQPIIQSIEEYFYSPYVSIWEIEQKEFGEAFNLVRASDPLYELIEDFNFITTKKIEIVIQDQTIVLRKGQLRNIDTSLYAFSKENNFETIIFCPIRIEKNIQGFIIIFSRSRNTSLIPEDKIFLNLIADKCGLAGLSYKLIRSFHINYSSNVDAELFVRLKNITDSAMNYLQADPVILFVFDRVSRNFLLGASISGKLRFPKLKKVIGSVAQQEADIAYQVIKKGSAFCKSHGDYLKIFYEDEKGLRRDYFRKNFWTRESIKSMAAIKLEHLGEPVGVMFFNYRSSQSFSDSQKGFIETFALLATRGIANARDLSLIRRKKEELEVKTQNLKEQQSIIAWQADEIYEETRRTSLYNITKGLNHEIRNNLLEIIGLESDINKDLENHISAKNRYRLSKFFQSINANAARIEDLLDEYRVEKRSREWFDPNEIIKDVIALHVARTLKTKKKNIVKSIEFREDFDPSIPDVYGVPSEFSMIIFNLVSNSIKAIEDKETIITGEIVVKTKSENNGLTVIIKDNGVGIDKKGIGAKVFQPHTKGRKGGVGYGLYFSKQLVENNFKGEISYDSKFGHWTKFYLYLPVKN